VLYYLGRTLQIIGLVVTGLGCIIAFDERTSERTMWTYCLAGVLAFAAGHFVMPRK
jgi:hypothetical protein